MKKLSIISIFLSVLFICISCQEKMICAAYQSTFLLDEGKQQLVFGPMINDSTPRTYRAKHAANLNGVGERHGYQQQSASIRMLAMEHQYRDRRLDTAVVKAEIDSSLMAEIDYSLIDNDSIPMDSLAGAEVNLADLDDDGFIEEEDEWSNTKRFNYNVDMVKYMQLVGNDVMLWQYERRENGIEAMSEPGIFTALWDSIKKLFSWKSSKKEESSDELTDEQEHLEESQESETSEESENEPTNENNSQEDGDDDF